MRTHRQERATPEERQACTATRLDFLLSSEFSADATALRSEERHDRPLGLFDILHLLLET